MQNVHFYTSILLLSRLSMRFWKFVITGKGKKKEKPLFWELQGRVSDTALWSVTDQNESDIRSFVARYRETQEYECQSVWVLA